MTLRLHCYLVLENSPFPLSLSSLEIERREGREVWLLDLLDGHDEEDARDGRKGRERGGLEQIEPRAAVGVEVEQSDDLTRDGRADVRAEDDADGLV